MNFSAALAPRRVLDSLLRAPVVGTVVAGLTGRARRARLDVGVGQLLVVLTGLLIYVSAPFLGMPAAEWRVLVQLSTVMLAIVVGSVWLPWNRWPAWTSMGLPVLGLGGLLVFGLNTDTAALAYVGVIPLWFVYAGVYLPRFAGPLLIPLAWFTYITMVGAFSSSAVVRLLIYSAAWFATSATLSVLVGRQRAVSDGLRIENTSDELTGLGNRRGLERRLVGLSSGDCVVICDLDLFKSINDAFGHAAGDEVLKRFGATINQQLRRRDYAGRYGGEEFVLLLLSTSPEQAVAFLTALRDEWLDLGDGVTFSAGVASVAAGSTPGAALSAADTALYEAKAAGRDCFRVAPATPARPEVPADLAALTSAA